MSHRAVCLVVGCLLVGGCASPTSSRYEGAEVGRPIETSRGTITSGRVVNVTGEANLIGPAAGGAIGGASVALGTHSGWAAVLGAVFGAGLGYLTQQAVNDREGIEYILQMEDGRTVTLVQNREGDEAPFPSGTPVLIQTGGTYNRVIPRTEVVSTAHNDTTVAGEAANAATAAASASTAAATSGKLIVDPAVAGTAPIAPPPPPTTPTPAPVTDTGRAGSTSWAVPPPAQP